MLVEEAGGIVSDSLGQPLDFGLGRTLGSNLGVVAARKEVHSKVLAAIKKAKEEEAVAKVEDENNEKSHTYSALT